MPHMIVRFSQNGTGARVSYLDDVSTLQGDLRVLIDPKLPRGIPPHEWKLVDGAIQGYVGATTQTTYAKPKWSLPLKLSTLSLAISFLALLTALFFHRG